MGLEEYILHHIDGEGEYLNELYRDTHLKLLYPRMASGHLQGRILKMLVRMIAPKRILEIGTYSGYSALCMAEGLPEGGSIYTFEINDEQEEFTRPWFQRSAYADRIKFYIGDALEIVPTLNVKFDLAFIDGDKRHYIEYYDMVLSHLVEGGFILVDNTLWDGHGTMRVTSIGDSTEIGKVAKQSTEQSGEPTPLNIQLTKLANIIGKVGFSVAGIAFVVFFVKDVLLVYDFASFSTFSDWLPALEDTLQYFMMAVTLIVVAVPEGLPMSVTLSLALNME